MDTSEQIFIMGPLFQPMCHSALTTGNMMKLETCMKYENFSTKDQKITDCVAHKHPGSKEI